MSKKINPKQEIRKALKHCENSQFSDAIVILQTVLEKYPNQIEALTILGNVYLHQKDIDLGIKYLERSLSINPQQNNALNDIGYGYYELKDYQKAISYFEKAIALNPNDFNPYFNMGRSFAGINEHLKAISFYEIAIKLNSNSSVIKKDIAISLAKKGEFKKAIFYLNEAIKIDKNSHQLYTLFGEILCVMKDYKGSIIAFQKSLELNPNNPFAMTYIGNNLRLLNKHDEAIEILEKSIKLYPNQDKPYHYLGLIFLSKNKGVMAKDNFVKAIAINPDFEEAKYFLSSLDDKAPNCAPKKYVEELFDEYSENYEESLVGELKSEVSENLINIIRKHNKKSLGEVLDLGCGTGLLGEKIKSFCDRLVGVDLSSNMLSKANEKSVYDELVHQDILEFLSLKSLKYNYYIFSDVFVYIGDLRDIFRIIKEKSEMEGILAFTTEHTEKDDYFLEKSGRFSHSKKYIESLSQELGYQIVHYEILNLRLENEKFIPGGYYLLKF